MKRVKRKPPRQGRERNYAEFQKGNFTILSRETFVDFHLLVTFKNSVQFVAEYIMQNCNIKCKYFESTRMSENKFQYNISLNCQLLYVSLMLDQYFYNGCVDLVTFKNYFKYQ